jgi:hypothetical protein
MHQAEHIMKKILTLFIAIHVLCLPALAQDGWRDLFNGRDLSGWEVLNGSATYHVEDGEIVGTSVWDSPNSFLCTEEHFTDFILEFETLADPVVNSGVQIRSNSFDEYRNGRVHGYQVEIDPAPRAYSGGIYDEARRFWLYSLSENPQARAAFRQGEWNHYRVEAIGSSFRVWLNGVQAVNLEDDLTPSGFIGLQVHSIVDREHIGKTVKWRNIRIRTDDLEDERWPAQPHVPVKNRVPNTLVADERRRGWRLLWDGESRDGWQSLDRLVSDETFGDFELSFEFNVSEGAAGGITYLATPEHEYADGLHYRLVDDQHHDDAQAGKNGDRSLGAAYDLIPPSNLSSPTEAKGFSGPGIWNVARIVVRGDDVQHWLNGFRIVEFSRSSQAFDALVSWTRHAGTERYGKRPSGHLVIDDDGGRIQYRSLKIREF